MINCCTEKPNKNKSKKRFVGVTEKYLKTEESLWWEVIREKLMFRMLWNTLKDGLCYLRNESVSMKVFFLKMHEVWLLFDLGKSTHHLIYYAYYTFFYENYWPRLAWSSKCRGSISHGDIKFWFSGNASTGRHCLLLQFHLSY